MYLLPVLFLTAATVGSLTNAYDLRTESASKRATICSDQLAACRNICAQKTLRNTCNTASMMFECVCSDHSVPTDRDISFPVAFFQCQGSLDECVGNCPKTQPNNPDGCRQVCETTFRCNNIQVNPNATLTPSTPPPTFRNDNRNGDEEENGASSGTQLGLAALLVAAITSLFYL